MNEDQALAKTTRINLLFDFYSSLLTEKQQTFMACYFHDDWSLGEIAAEYAVSRQAVFEHIKRSEVALEEYESKLHLAEKHEERGRKLEALKAALETARCEEKEHALSLIGQIEALA